MSDAVRLHRYVYYTVVAAHADTLRARVVAMQAALFERTGCAGRLMRRPEPKDGRETWMEVYEDVDATFDAALATFVDACGLADVHDDGAVGPRRVERFVEAVAAFHPGHDDASEGRPRCA